MFSRIGGEPFQVVPGEARNALPGAGRTSPGSLGSSWEGAPGLGGNLSRLSWEKPGIFSRIGGEPDQVVPGEPCHVLPGAGRTFPGASGCARRCHSC